MKSKKRIISGLCITTALCFTGCGTTQNTDTATISSVVSENHDSIVDTTTESESASTEPLSSDSKKTNDTKKTENNSNNEKTDSTKQTVSKNEQNNENSNSSENSSNEENAETDNKDKATTGENASKGIDASSFIGTWSEEYAHRGVIEISAAKDGTYIIQVKWSGSAFEQGIWSMKASYNKETEELEYYDASYITRTYSDEDTYVDEPIYDDGSGLFFFENGKLGWVSDYVDFDYIDGTYFYTRGRGDEAPGVTSDESKDKHSDTDADDASAS